jgi:hypothetical protein
MKPTPEEKCPGCGLSDCVHWEIEKSEKMNKPSHSPEAKKRDIPLDEIQGCLKGKIPAPEARVDWEKEAREIVEKYKGSWFPHEMQELIAKALSNAFEKGREAR